jgi:hypothetical protein
MANSAHHILANSEGDNGLSIAKQRFWRDAALGSGNLIVSLFQPKMAERERLMARELRSESRIGEGTSDH